MEVTTFFEHIFSSFSEIWSQVDEITFMQVVRLNTDFLKVGQLLFKRRIILYCRNGFDAGKKLANVVSTINILENDKN